MASSVDENMKVEWNKDKLNGPFTGQWINIGPKKIRTSYGERIKNLDGDDWAGGTENILEEKNDSVSKSLVCGAIETIWCHPTDSNIIILGAVGAGIYKTTNAKDGNDIHWKLKSDEVIGITKIRSDIENSERLVAVGGYSSAYSNIGVEPYKVKKDGILVSVDQGETWSLKPIKINNNIEYLDLNDVVVWGNNILVASHRFGSFNQANEDSLGKGGLFFSSDFGDNWDHLDINNTLWNNKNIQCTTALEITKISGVVSIFSALLKDGLFKGIFDETTKIWTWNKITENPSPYPNNMSVKEKMGYMIQFPYSAGLTNLTNNNLLLATSGYDKEFIYLTIVNNGITGGFFYSTDNGNTWLEADLPRTSIIPEFESKGPYDGLQPSIKKSGGYKAPGNYKSGGQGEIHGSLIGHPENIKNGQNLVFIGGDRQPAMNNFEEERLYNNWNYFNLFHATIWNGRLFRGDLTKQSSVDITKGNNGLVNSGNWYTNGQIYNIFDDYSKIWSHITHTNKLNPIQTLKFLKTDNSDSAISTTHHLTNNCVVTQDLYFEIKGTSALIHSHNKDVIVTQLNSNAEGLLRENVGASLTTIKITSTNGIKFNNTDSIIIDANNINETITLSSNTKLIDSTELCYTINLNSIINKEFNSDELVRQNLSDGNVARGVLKYNVNSNDKQLTILSINGIDFIKPTTANEYFLIGEGNPYTISSDKFDAVGRAFVPTPIGYLFLPPVYDPNNVAEVTASRLPDPFSEFKVRSINFQLFEESNNKKIFIHTGINKISSLLEIINFEIDFGNNKFNPTNGVVKTNFEGLDNGGTANRSAPHADSRCMAFDADGNLIQGDDGGINKLINPLDKNKAKWYSLCGDLCTFEAHNIAFDEFNQLAFIGTQDNYNLLGDEDIGFCIIGGGDGGNVQILNVGGEIYYYRTAQMGGITLFNKWDGSEYNQNTIDLQVTRGTSIDINRVNIFLDSLMDFTPVVEICYKNSKYMVLYSFSLKKINVLDFSQTNEHNRNLSSFYPSSKLYTATVSTVWEMKYTLNGDDHIIYLLINDGTNKKLELHYLKNFGETSMASVVSSQDLIPIINSNKFTVNTVDKDISFTSFAVNNDNYKKIALISGNIDYEFNNISDDNKLITMELIIDDSTNKITGNINLQVIDLGYNSLRSCIYLNIRNEDVVFLGHGGKKLTDTVISSKGGILYYNTKTDKKLEVGNDSLGNQQITEIIYVESKDLMVISTMGTGAWMYNKVSEFNKEPVYVPNNGEVLKANSEKKINEFCQARKVQLQVVRQQQEQEEKNEEEEKRLLMLSNEKCVARQNFKGRNPLKKCCPCESKSFFAKNNVLSKNFSNQSNKMRISNLLKYGRR